jgi:hypothetical protein
MFSITFVVTYFWAIAFKALKYVSRFIPLWQGHLVTTHIYIYIYWHFFSLSSSTFVRFSLTIFFFLSFLFFHIFRTPGTYELWEEEKKRKKSSSAVDITFSFDDDRVNIIIERTSMYHIHSLKRKNGIHSKGRVHLLITQSILLFLSKFFSLSLSPSSLVKPCNRYYHHKALTEVSSPPFKRNKLLLCWIAFCLFLASLLFTHPSLHNEIDQPSKSYIFSSDVFYRYIRQVLSY